MSNADHSVALVAIVDHPGYNYDGIPYQIVAEGQKFNTTPARAARLLAKGIAKLDASATKLAEDAFEELAVVRAAAKLAFVDDEPVKIDKRTKAYRDSKG